MENHAFLKCYFNHKKMQKNALLEKNCADIILEQILQIYNWQFFIFDVCSEIEKFQSVRCKFTLNKIYLKIDHKHLKLN